MNFSEEPVRFDCANETLLGILARPAHPAGIGVVIIVGGPQTRVGSHRQFVLLARALAAAGYPALRFDARGRGDSTGSPRDFEAITPDIGAAVDALRAACPAVERIALWGLCDAASAALLYCDDTRDSRIAGLCLLNPWARSEATLAKTQVKHYYGQRLLQPEFWRKLLTGRLNIARALAEFLRKLTRASRAAAPTGVSPRLTFQERMARGWRDFPGSILLILSDDDYTAKEFLEYVAAHSSWQGALSRPALSRIDVAEADHTFSSAAWREKVETASLGWLRAMT